MRRPRVVLGLVLAVLIVGATAGGSGCASLLGSRSSGEVVVDRPRVSVEIVSDPPGADVFHEGRHLGRTPLTTQLDYEKVQPYKRLDMNVGGYVANAAWVLVEGVGVLFVIADLIVDGSDGAIDLKRETRGQTFERARTHRLVFRKDGLRDTVATVSVPASLRVRARLAPAAAADVRRLLASLDASISRLEALAAAGRFTDLRFEAEKARDEAARIGAAIEPGVIRPFLAGIEEAARAAARGAGWFERRPAARSRLGALRVRGAAYRLERYSPLSSEVGLAGDGPETYASAVLRLRALASERGPRAAGEARRIAARLPMLAEANIAAPARRAAAEDAARLGAAFERLRLAAERRDSGAARAALAEAEPPLATLQALLTALE